MYTNLHPDDMDAAMRRNLTERLPYAVEPARGRPYRAVRAISVPRHTSGVRGCRLGPSYDEDEFVTIPISTLLELGAYTSRRSIIQIGSELRHYRLGTPMGHQESCAKANGVALDAELRFAESRDDSARDLSASFVDDMFVRVAYAKDDPSHPWTRASALEYARGLTSCFPEPLRME